MAYEVQTPVYEGPFDLLLHLILRDQVDLYQVSLSEIVDVYLVEMERMETLDLEVATEFLLIAATLVELKTRRLLPGEVDLDLDDEFGLWEARDLLLARLLECKTFKDASRALQRILAEAARSFPRTAGMEEHFVDLAPDILEGVTPVDLRAAFLHATRPKIQPRIDLDHVAPIRASVTDAVAGLLRELPRLERTSFRSLTEGMVERLDVVIHFLAILELFKQGLVDLAQFTTFGDIQIIWIGGSGADLADLALVDSYDG